MPPKRQRSRSARIGALQKLLHTGKITQEGLVELIQAFRDLGDDLPDNVNRWSMTDANHARFKSVAYVEKMQLEEGGSWDWEMAEPNKLLTLMVSESSVLQGLFAEAVRRRAPSISNPWTLVIGYDEFSPGGMFDTDNDRKSMNLSYTFLELGEHNIWFTRAWRSFGTVKLTSSMDFADEPEQANQFLACGHRFHKYCLDTFCSVSNTTLDNISCLLCHKLVAECREEADQLMSGCFGTALSRARFNFFFS